MRGTTLLTLHRTTRSRGTPSSAEGDGLRAVAGVVRNRQRAVESTHSAGRESHSDGAACFGRESWATGVGLSKICTDGDTRNIERPGAGVGEHDGARDQLWKQVGLDPR